MAKYTLITGRTEILAAIYDEKNLPTAVLSDHREDHDPVVPNCLHSLRYGTLEVTEGILQEFADACGVDKEKEPEKIVARLYPFYEDYPQQHHNCIGCHRAAEFDENVEGHRIHSTEEYARKLCEDCA